jgi:hypothetical protein
MPENSLPDGQSPDAAGQPANPHPGATAKSPEQLGLDRAASGATQQALSAGVDGPVPIKRRPGQRGPDKQPRKPRAVPVAPVGRGATAAPLEEMPAPAVEAWPGAGPDPGPVVDVEAERLFVDGALDLLELATGALKSVAVYRISKDPKLSDAAYESAKIPPAIREKLQASGALLVRKYALDTQYAPEMAFAGGLVLYLGKNALDVRKLKAELNKPAVPVNEERKEAA